MQRFHSEVYANGGDERRIKLSIAVLRHERGLTHARVPYHQYFVHVVEVCVHGGRVHDVSRKKTTHSGWLVLDVATLRVRDHATAEEQQQECVPRELTNETLCRSRGEEASQQFATRLRGKEVTGFNQQPTTSLGFLSGSGCRSFSASLACDVNN